MKESAKAKEGDMFKRLAAKSESSQGLSDADLCTQAISKATYCFADPICEERIWIF